MILTRPACDRGAHDRVATTSRMQAAFGHVVQRLHRIAIGDLRHVEALALEEARDHQIGRAGDRRPVELAGLRARHRHELAERLDVERGGTASAISVALTRATGARSRGS